MTDKKYEAQLDELIERVLTAPADAFTALPDDNNALRSLCDSLDARTPADLCQSLELAAAAPLVLEAQDAAAMPQHLRRRIELDAPKHVGSGARAPRPSNVTPLQGHGKTAPQESSDASGSRWLANAGWLAAAAMLLVMLIDRSEEANEAVQTPPQVAEVTPEPASAPSDILDRDQLLALTDTITVQWRRPEQPGFENVTGDVVWNDTLQQGYMRLANMPVNDAAARQYQLWIVDPDRDAEPVDGGVFDIVAASGEVLIPIDAKLQVAEPTVFAITLEQRGGVVVSEGPLIVVAPVAT